MADEQEPQEQQQDYRLDVLRAAGHEDAATLLSKLPQPVAEPEPEPAPEPPQQRTLTPVEAAEAQRQAEGQAMLDAMGRQLGRQWATVEGPAGDGR